MEGMYIAGSQLVLVCVCKFSVGHKVPRIYTIYKSSRNSLICHPLHQTGAGFSNIPHYQTAPQLQPKFLQVVFCYYPWENVYLSAIFISP